MIDQVVTLSSTRAAEMTKLLENIHRAVNIGLVNALKIVCDRMDIDIHEVIRAATTKPFGFTPYSPGPGLGGHCIPIDPFYLTWKAREYGLSTHFIELAGEVNTPMPKWVVSKVVDALNDRGQAIKGARILILGIAYKKNVDDRRESPSIELMELLQARGAVISYSDPHVPRFIPMRQHDFDLDSVPLTPETLAATDCVLLATDHDRFDYDLIPRTADCRYARALPRVGAEHCAGLSGVQPVRHRRLYRHPTRRRQGQYPAELRRRAARSATLHLPRSADSLLI